MKGKRTDFSEDPCAIARSLDVIGDWWSLLIVRDALAGRRRFSDFEKRLGMAKNILAQRLRKLVAHGILEQVPAEGSAFKEYQLTEKGRALNVVLVALWQWGESYCFAPQEPTPTLVDRRDRAPLPKLKIAAGDGRSLAVGEYEPSAGR